MAALPVVCSDDEEWSTAGVLRNDRPESFPHDLDEADLAICAAAELGGASAYASAEGGGSCNGGPSTAEQTEPGDTSCAGSHHMHSQNNSNIPHAQASWGGAIAAAHVDPGAQYHDLRGKHDRTNT
eukprot:6187721-Pleurochrysis_carterae.AAC.1